MKKTLPAQPSLAHLRNQAKDLLKQIRAANSEAVVRLQEQQRSSDGTVTLSVAQLVIAREYGFASWPRLKQHVELVAGVEARIARLRSEFASGDAQTKHQLLKAAHTRTRFEHYDPDAASISEADARLLVANEEGYAYWSKYESFLHLDPSVQTVIAAVRSGDLSGLQEILRSDPKAANPQWVSGYSVPKPVPNDSVPLFCVAEAIFRKTNARGNEYDLTRELIAAGAAVDVEGGLPLTAAVSFNAIHVVEALLDCGAMVDGVDRDGVPLAYAMHFGFGEIAELLSRRGAQLDLRFAAGLGRLDLAKDWFNQDGSLKPGAGSLADPYGLESKMQGQSPFRCERNRRNILNQALYFACVHAKLEVADFLLAQGADINAIVPGLDSQATILHRVIWMPKPQSLIRALLDRGANPSIRDQEHHATPADWARFYKREDIAALLDSPAEAQPG